MANIWELGNRDETDTDELVCKGCEELIPAGAPAFLVPGCGVRCVTCIWEHCTWAGHCDTCRAFFAVELQARADAWDAAHGITRDEDALPGFAPAIAEQAAAADAQRGADLTQTLLQPPADVSRITGRMESHSPLFRGSAADPQLQLF